MDLQQSLFPPQHLQTLPGKLPTDLGEVELDGETFQVRNCAGMEGDLALITELGAEPDLYDAVYLVEAIVECLEGTKIAHLCDTTEIGHLVGDFEVHTAEDTLQKMKAALAANSHEGLVPQFESFILTCRELLPKLAEFDTKGDADPTNRFNVLQPILVRIVEAHREFYLKFREM